MPEYIEREAAIEALRDAYGNSYRAEDYIRAIPAADVKPVVHGEWMGEKTRYFSGQPRFVYHCSRCGSTEEHVYPETKCAKFCPNCGASMEDDNG